MITVLDRIESKLFVWDQNSNKEVVALQRLERIVHHALEWCMAAIVIERSHIHVGGFLSLCNNKKHINSYSRACMHRAVARSSNWTV